MLELDVRQYLRRTDPDRVADLLGELYELEKADPFRGLERMLEEIGARPRIGDSNFFRLALNYHLGIVEAYRNRPERMARAIRDSTTLIGIGGDELFSDHVASSLAVAEKQQAAIERGIPSIPISSMPRAASAAFTQTLRETLDVPVARMSIGDFPSYWLAPSWVARFRLGGCVLHDHFGASPFNLEVLKEHGIRRVFVLLRDPRAAAASIVTMAYGTGQSPEAYEKLVLEALRKSYRPWLKEWFEAARSDALEVHWIRSSDVTAGPESLARVVAIVCEIVGIDPERRKEVEIVSANFVTGSSDAWRQKISEKAQAEMWDLLPAEAIELLELKP